MKGIRKAWSKEILETDFLEFGDEGGADDTRFT
jgi:hypothetical protein